MSFFLELPYFKARLTMYWKRILSGLLISILLIMAGFLLLERTDDVPLQTSEASTPSPSSKLESLDESDEHCHFSDEILAMAKGVDITKLDLLPVSLKGIGANPGTKSQLIKLTCDKGFYKLDSDGKILTRYPDQFQPNSYESISAFGTMRENEERTEKRTMDSKLSIAGSVGISAFKFGMFSASASYERKRKQMITGESYISEMNILYIIRTAEFRTPTSRFFPLEGNDDFQYLIDNLNPHFESDPESYFEVLEKYGTHYFTSARFGGFVKINTEVTKELRDKMSEDAINTKLNFNYKLLLEGKLDFDAFDKKTDNEFYGLSSSSKYSHGGDPSVVYTGNLDKWIVSVLKSPRLVGGKVLPISNIVRNKTIKASVEKAIQSYLVRAYLQDLKACLQISLDSGIGGNTLQRRLQLAIINRISNSNVVLQDDAQLERLGKDVSLSIFQQPWRYLIVNIIGAQRNFPSRTEFCNHVEFNIAPALGVNIERFPMRSFKTEMLKGNDLKWNKKFKIDVNYEANIQFCYYSNACGGSSVTGIPIEQIDCNRYTPILEDDRNTTGSPTENVIRFSEVSLTFQINWEPAAKMDSSNLTPI